MSTTWPFAPDLLREADGIARLSRPWTWRLCGRILVDVHEPEPGWRPGDHIFVDLPDGQTVRCRVVNIEDDGTIQVVPRARGGDPIGQSPGSFR